MQVVLLQLILFLILYILVVLSCQVLQIIKKIYSHISPRLKSEFNTQVSLDAFPQKTMDALSYGVFKGIYLLIKDAAQNKKLYFTGGDGQFLANYFDHAIYDKLLIFRGMKKIIKENPNLLY